VRKKTPGLERRGSGTIDDEQKRKNQEWCKPHSEQLLGGGGGGGGGVGGLRSAQKFRDRCFLSLASRGRGDAARRRWSPFGEVPNRRKCQRRRKFSNKVTGEMFEDV